MTTSEEYERFRDANRKLKESLDARDDKIKTTIQILRENMPKLIKVADKEAVINMVAQLIGGTLSSLAFIMYCMDTGIDPMVGWSGLQLVLSAAGGIMYPKLHIPVSISLIVYYGVKFYRG